MKLTVISPYDDNKLVYNKQTARYELTKEYIKDEFENTFKDDNTLQQRIKKNTRKVYNYLLYRTCTPNKEVVDFVLNQTKEGRAFLLDLLSEQMEADLESGYNSMSSIPAINYASGRITPREEQQRNQLTVDAEQIVERNANYFGFNLFYQSSFPFSYFQFMRANKKE